MPPVIPLIAAAATASAGWAGAVALVGGTITAASIAGGLMVAGAAMTAVGALTGNKSLLKLGGVVSMVGGVANLAAGALSSAGQAAADAAAPSALDAGGQVAGDAAGAVSETANAAGAAAAEGAGELAQGGIVNSEIAGATADTALSSSTPAAAAAAEPAAAMVTEPAASLVADASAAAPAGIVDGSAIAGTHEVATQGIVDASAPMQPGAQAIERMAGMGGEAAPGFLDKVSEFGGKATDFMKNNKELVNTASGLVQGAMKSYGDQTMMKERVRMQEDYEKRQRARISASLKGLQMPVYQRPGAK